MVVNLAVGDDPRLAVRSRDRLVTTGGIDDGQACVPESDSLWMNVSGSAVRTAMRLELVHALDAFSFRCSPNAGNATHREASLLIDRWAGGSSDCRAYRWILGREPHRAKGHKWTIRSGRRSATGRDKMSVRFSCPLALHRRANPDGCGGTNRCASIRSRKPGPVNCGRT